jgi:hypothetical protein
MKRVLFPIFFCILILGQTLHGQVQKKGATAKTTSAPKLSADDYPSLKIHAQEMNTAGLTGDYAKLADYTHPKIVAAAGGRAKLIDLIKKGFDQTKADGFEVVSNDIESIDQIEKIGAELYALIRTKMIVKTPEGKIFFYTSLVGISSDTGNNWKFVSAPDHEQFKVKFPAAAAKITIPKRERPALLEN